MSLHPSASLYLRLISRRTASKGPLSGLLSPLCTPSDVSDHNCILEPRCVSNARQERNRRFESRAVLMFVNIFMSSLFDYEYGRAKDMDRSSSVVWCRLRHISITRKQTDALFRHPSHIACLLRFA